MTFILLLRHAESEWNREGRFQGWADPPLSASGRCSAETWGQRTGMTFDAVVSSDLTRSRATAQLIARAITTAEVEVRPGLREQDQGAWTGLTKAEVRRVWPELSRKRPRQPYGGETQTELTERVMADLEDIRSRYRGRRVLAVTHAGVIKAVERTLGCDAFPVPHLAGRWISLTDQRTQPSSSSAQATAAHGWTAGSAVPEGRLLPPTRAAGSAAGAR